MLEWNDLVDNESYVTVKPINDIAHAVIKNIGDITKLHEENDDIEEKISQNSSRIEVVNSRLDNFSELYSEGVKILNKELQNHEKRIVNLERGISAEPFLTDNSVAHIKIAPERACPYAQINSIGGKTVRKYGENLMDDSYTLNEGGGHIPDVEIAYIDLEIGTYYFEYSASDSRVGVGYYAYDENGRYERIYPEDKGFITITTPNEYIFFVHSFDGPIDEGKYTVNTFLAKPEGFAPTKTTAIKVKTPNLLPFPYTSIRVGQEVMDVGFKTNWAGLDWEVKADGSIVVNGTATGSPVLALSKDYLYADDDLYFSGSPEGGSSSTYYMVCYLEGATQNTDIGKGNKIPKGSRYRLGCYIIKGTVCDNLTFKPMITYGNIKQPYSPPNESPTIYEIPESIQSIEGYGEGNPDDASEYNYIDCLTHNFVAKGKMVDGKWVRNEPVIETPIVFDKWLEVKGASLIEFVNEGANSIPSSITYMLKGY